MEEKLGCTSVIKHRIELLDPTPFKQPLRRMAFTEKEYIKEQTDQMLKMNVIRESTSPFASPIVLVKKKDNSTRFCIDFRRLNAQTKKWVFPLPNQEDIIEAGAGARYFTTLDLNNGYWQMEMDEDSSQYTAFMTSDNQYEFVRMPFGLANAAASFSKLMSTIMAGLVGSAVHIYLDDLVVMSKDWNVHMKSLKDVLQRIKSANLTIKLAKCKFAHEQAEVLGHVLSQHGIKPQPGKLAAIERLVAPDSVEKVRQFLGFTGYYRKFVPTFAALSGPLADLTKKDSRFKWGEEEQRSFTNIKNALLNSKAISYYQQGLPLMIKTDASRRGFAGILLQMQGGDWRMIATTSRRLSSAEANFSVTELEGGALVYTLQKFRPFVYGQKVKVVVDHCALCALARTKPLSGRLARWAIALSEFELEIVYQSGQKHADVDCLSRQPSADKDDNLDENRFIFALIPLNDFASEYNTDEECRQALESIDSGGQNFKLTNNLIYKDSKLLVPGIYRQEIISNIHSQGHAGLAQAINLVQRKYYWKDLTSDVKRLVSTCKTCQLHKVPREKPAGLMHTFSPTKPFETCIDHLGTLDTTRKGHKHVLVAVDAFSKFMIAAPTMTTSAEEIVRFIINKS